MKKEISPEMYNYNKFPGPSFARIGNKVVSENIELNIVDDFKDAFDQTAFGQRFSPIMLKFDYIIGDWGNEQLRLKGFYRDEKPVKSDLKIGRLDDYLTEYCNFGCAYFVLENPNPQELEEEPEEKTSRKRHRSRNRNRQKQRTEELVSKDKKVIRNEPKRSKSTSISVSLSKSVTKRTFLGFDICVLNKVLTQIRPIKTNNVTRTKT